MLVQAHPLSFALRITLVFAGVCASAVDAQTVQLPSVRTFSYSGSVLVPDRGTASLGSVGRTASSRNRSGLRAGAGRSTSLGNAVVTATITDHQQIDRQLLGPGFETAPRVPDRTEEGKSLVRHGRVMYRSGNYAAANASYQMAIQALSGPLKTLAKAEYDRFRFATAAK
ncbi:hypothetical protein K227x_42120 [Rubripirellula lacrimiformis]|uniref:Tetratricopeptide repeat protein n=1 Tax=Rubripirellula lacrimiformis TaxID=1930273 RepID=A0A517NFA8_9BACT|nr:hypothetical protein [Rubripirellula lacrimiformis]QDT05807.1 hypothetical protein K227x_42120 [Rubripirellula lacrimiformis]